MYTPTLHTIFLLLFKSIRWDLLLWLAVVRKLVINVTTHTHGTAVVHCVGDCVWFEITGKRNQPAMAVAILLFKPLKTKRLIYTT